MDNLFQRRNNGAIQKEVEFIAVQGLPVHRAHIAREHSCMVAVTIEVGTVFSDIDIEVIFIGESGFLCVECQGIVSFQELCPGVGFFPEAFCLSYHKSTKRQEKAAGASPRPTVMMLRPAFFR